jgi:hypothetical protein
MKSGKVCSKLEGTNFTNALASKGIMNYLRRTAKGCEKTGEVTFPGTFLTLLAEAEKSHKNLCRCSGGGSNRVSLEHKSRML